MTVWEKFLYDWDNAHKKPGFCKDLALFVVISAVYLPIVVFVAASSLPFIFLQMAMEDSAEVKWRWKIQRRQIAQHFTDAERKSYADYPKRGKRKW